MSDQRIEQEEQCIEPEESEDGLKKLLKFQWLEIAIVFVFIGGMVCFWNCFAVPEQQMGLPVVKMSVPVSVSGNAPTSNKDISFRKERSEQETFSLVPVSLGVSSCSRVSSSNNESVTSSLTESPLRSRIYPGRVFAFKKSILTFRVPGPLLKINVVPGQVVKKGKTLMQIDPRDYQIQVDLAQARLDSAG